MMNFAFAGFVMGYSDETGAIALWIRIGRWTSLCATTALLVYPGREFFVGAWRDLRNRRLGMDVPIVIGLVCAYLGSAHTTWTGSGEVYYDTIAMFVFLVLLARRIELRGRLHAANALDRVDRILPRLARRLEPAGEREVLVTELAPGDRVRVLPGEVVPTDGRLIGGGSNFDESALTGEPLPITHTAGDPVIAGTCNVAQPVIIEVEKAADDSTLQARGLVVIALYGDRAGGALFTLSDGLRPDAAERLTRLRKLGVRRLALLSGDNRASVEYVAGPLAFDEVHGEMQPVDKLDWIRARQAEGRRVAMIGDGINDAPTLAAADVSLSFAHATELAQANSGLLVLGRDLAVIGEARGLATRIRRVIRQNLIWAAGYNLLAVPAAAIGMLPPWGAAIGMSLSSLLVVLNALRLRARDG